jgi:stage V sporulation protein SpoVS
MPPHCDSLDGPVVTAARDALEASNVEIVLPFVPEQGEAEVRAAFAAVQPVRAMCEQAKAVADRHFFETVVRTHRAGEGAPYTGLKPAGSPVGPVIPMAEEAVATGSPERLTVYLAGVLQGELSTRLGAVGALAVNKGKSVADGRRYVEAMLGFEVYCHTVFEALHAQHEHGGQG